MKCGIQDQVLILLPHLSYSVSRTQEEMAHACRGTINLTGAFITMSNSTQFTVSNGTSQVYHIRALSRADRQRWVTALLHAMSEANRNDPGYHSMYSIVT